MTPQASSEPPARQPTTKPVSPLASRLKRSSVFSLVTLKQKRLRWTSNIQISKDAYLANMKLRFPTPSMMGFTSCEPYLGGRRHKHAVRFGSKGTYWFAASGAAGAFSSCISSRGWGTGNASAQANMASAITKSRIGVGGKRERLLLVLS